MKELHFLRSIIFPKRISGFHNFSKSTKGQQIWRRKFHDVGAICYGRRTDLVHIHRNLMGVRYLDDGSALRALSAIFQHKNARPNTAQV